MPLVGIGDAASTFDPLWGQGIAKALQSGIFASYAVADLLRQNDSRGLKRFRSYLLDGFAAYRETLRDYYALETRWPTRPFWRRRLASGADADAASGQPPA
jgi:flavin-dependent dehydrogenase